MKFHNGHQQEGAIGIWLFSYTKICAKHSVFTFLVIILKIISNFVPRRYFDDASEKTK